MFGLSPVALAAGLLLTAGSVPQFSTISEAEQPAPSVSARAQSRWVLDEQSGCRALDPDFVNGDAVVWDEPCTAGVVSGKGMLTFINKGQPQVSISGAFRNGALEPGRASLAWPDGSKYDGDQVDGRFNGQGVFISAAGDRLDGQWSDGKLNGHGVVNWINGNRYEGEWREGDAEGKGVEVWTNGDRYDGEWHEGKASGHGEQVWANGQRYVGEWSNDLPNGKGELTRSDGTKIAGNFVDGHPPASAKLAAAMQPNSPAARGGNASETPKSTSEQDSSHTGAPGTHLDNLVGTKLLSVDGSSMMLSDVEGGFARAITQPDGRSSTIDFTFLSDRLGTVADAADVTAVIGLFRLTDDEIVVDYADGHSEVLKPYAAGEVVLAMHSPDGSTSCTAWYRDNHSFSEDERKAPLAQYATGLGVTVSVAKGNRARHPSVCGIALASAGTMSKLLAVRAPRPLPRPIRASYVVPEPASLSDNRASVTLSRMLLQPPQTIVVRNSDVHLIDQPKPPGLPAAASQDVKLAAIAPATLPRIAVLVPPSPGGAAATASTPGQPYLPVDPYRNEIAGTGASPCLSVGSDGTHWGFKNHCSYAIQFVYCLKGTLEPLAACSDGAVPGSAAPDSFSALVADASMKEQNIDHQFRWVACGGGAGEVVPHMDSVDPPTGRCVRRAAARN